MINLTPNSTHSDAIKSAIAQTADTIKNNIPVLMQLATPNYNLEYPNKGMMNGLELSLQNSVIESKRSGCDIGADNYIVLHWTIDASSLVPDDLKNSSADNDKEPVAIETNDMFELAASDKDFINEKLPRHVIVTDLNFYAANRSFTKLLLMLEMRIGTNITICGEFCHVPRARAILDECGVIVSKS